MNRQQIAIMLSCAAVVYACAPRNHITGDTIAHDQPAPLAQLTDSSGVALTVTQPSGRKGLAFAIEYKNKGKLTELKFANGRTHEFVVLDSRDREVWRWSAGRLFTQSLQTKQLKNGDAVRYEATWDSAAPGTYRVVASLNSATHSEPVEQEFVVR